MKPIITNLLSHKVTVMIEGEKVEFPPADKSSKPIVRFKTVKVDNPYIPFDGGDTFPVRVDNIPKLKHGELFIVNTFILDALVQMNPKYAAYFVAPGKQIHGRNGKIDYAENFYYKGL